MPKILKRVGRAIKTKYMQAQFENEKDQGKFVVDLGSLQLDAEQRNRINAAIHQAVAGQLATLNFKDQVALFPITDRPIGPILQGLIARRIPSDKLNTILQF